MSEMFSPIRVHIRWMIRRDMEEVLEIERDGFQFPWTDEDFIRCLKQRNCIGMVAEHDARVVGFMVYEMHRTRLHLLNIAAAVGYRRLSVGSQLVAKLVGLLSSQRRNRLRLEVMESNLDAQLFFKSQGFLAVSVLHDFYQDTDTDEDAYSMEYRISADVADLGVGAAT